METQTKRCETTSRPGPSCREIPTTLQWMIALPSAMRRRKSVPKKSYDLIIVLCRHVDALVNKTLDELDECGGDQAVSRVVASRHESQYRDSPLPLCPTY